MKKVLFVLLVFMQFFSGCQNKVVQTSSYINLTDVDSITIKALPNPPTIKRIDKKDDINEIITHINSIHKEKVKQEDIKGWEFYIQAEGKNEHFICLVGNMLNIDGIWYEAEVDEIKNFRDLYNNLNYKEENVTK